MKARYPWTDGLVKPKPDGPTIQTKERDHRLRQALLAQEVMREAAELGEELIEVWEAE